MIQINLLTKQKETHRHKMNLWFLGVRDSWGVWEGHVHTGVFKMDNQQDLLYSIWNSAQCYVPAWMGRGFGGEWIHIYGWLSPFSVHLKLPQHC